MTQPKMQKMTFAVAYPLAKMGLQPQRACMKGLTPEDAEEWRRLQNRTAQRTFRKNAKAAAWDSEVAGPGEVAPQLQKTTGRAKPKAAAAGKQAGEAAPQENKNRKRATTKPATL